MSKAPFSFFTQTKGVLESFKPGSSSNGGTLSLTLYGSNVPVLATSTASAIGLGSTQIDFLKFIMTVGLWIALAWFIYWRIGGMFQYQRL